MTHNFYCDEVLSGKTPVQKVMETDHVLAYHAILSSTYRCFS